jgi:hypothetical protein
MVSDDGGNGIHGVSPGPHRQTPGAGKPAGDEPDNATKTRQVAAAQRLAASANGAPAVSDSGGAEFMVFAGIALHAGRGTPLGDEADWSHRHTTDDSRRLRDADARRLRRQGPRVSAFRTSFGAGVRRRKCGSARASDTRRIWRFVRSCFSAGWSALCLKRDARSPLRRC